MLGFSLEHLLCDVLSLKCLCPGQVIAQNIPKDMPIQTLHTKASRTLKEDKLVTLGDVKTTCARSYQLKKIKTYGDTQGP